MATLLARGMGASPGKATGAIALRPEDAVAAAARGEPVILVRVDAAAEDVPGMQAAAGVVTTHGGITGDAAIVARSLGKPCIASCSAIRVDYAAGAVIVWRDGSDEDLVLRAGERITIDGASGEIWSAD